MPAAVGVTLRHDDSSGRSADALPGPKADTGTLMVRTNTCIGVIFVFALLGLGPFALLWQSWSRSDDNASCALALELSVTGHGSCAPLPSFADGAYEPVPSEVLSSLELSGRRTRRDDAPLGRPLRCTPRDGGVYGALRPPAPDAPPAPPPDLARWHVALARAARPGANLSVLVLGGSTTAGHLSDGHAAPHSQMRVSRCLDDAVAAAAPCAAALNASGEGVTSANADCRPCAWPARLRRWLRAAYPHAASVKVDNRAVGATNSRTVF